MRNRNDYYGSDYDRNYYGSAEYGRNFENRNRDWADRAGDEVRSWFGDGEAERRRRRDDREEYRSGGYGNNYGGYNQSNYGSAYDRNYGSHETNFGGNYSNPGLDHERYFRNSGYNSGSGIYGNRGYGNSGYNQTYGSYDSDRRFSGSHGRDWADRAGDEVRSWFGDDEAERRRYADEIRDENRDWGRNRYSSRRYDRW